MSPEEVRIQKWLRNHFVAVPSFDGKMVQPWLLPMDLALCGLWPVLDVIKSSFGGVEGFERALVLASVNDETELVIGGSRDDYKLPGQLALRAVFVARRANPVTQTYSLETMVSLQDRRGSMAPTRSCLDAMRQTVIAQLRPVIEKAAHDRAVAAARQLGGGIGGGGGSGLGGVMDAVNAINGTNPDATKLGLNTFWALLRPTDAKIEWSGILTAESQRAYADAVARDVARSLQPGHSGFTYTPTPPPPTLASELGDFKRYGVAGIVTGQAQQWVSQATIDQMVKDGDLEALSKVPQGRALLSASIGGG